jgi:hypothetical protein
MIGVGVTVGVLVSVAVGVLVGVWVAVGVNVGVLVGVGVRVGVLVGIGVGVADGGSGGSYNSALSRTKKPSWPPATSTRPLFKSVAVCDSRGALRAPVVVHAPIAGSYNSALGRV